MATYLGAQFGNYQLRSLVGRGGFAEVYLGEHVYLKSKAAIKILLTQLTEQDRENFLAEARTLVNLNHPHIVRLLDFGTQNDQPFLVMEYAPNGSLRSQYPRGRLLPLQDVILYIKQVASALQYAHDENIVHRDIKPENMLIGRRQEILLTDFGIALPTPNSRTQSVQEVAGTASYMSPEQLQGRPRPASDQYALGIVAYEWLSGSPPFKGSFMEVTSQHMVAAPPPLQGRIPGITPQVEQVLMIALAKEYKLRFPNVLAFANALEEATNTNQATYLFSQNTPSQGSVPTSGSNFLTADTVIAPPVTPRGLNTPFTGMPSGFPSTPGLSTTPPFNYAHTPQNRTPTSGEWAASMSTASPPSTTNTPSFAGSTTQQSSAAQGSDRQTPSHQKTTGPSRRTVIVSAALGAAAISVGAIGATLWLNTQNQHQGSTSTEPSTTITPTSSSLLKPETRLTARAMFGGNPQHTREITENIISPANVSKLTLKWATSTDGILSLSSAAVVDDKIYIGSHSGKILCFNAQNGAILWQKPLGDVGFSSPAVTDNMVYIGSMDQNLYALDRNSGETRWSFPTGGGILSSPTVIDGVVYFGSKDANIYAVDAKTGKAFWHAPTGDAIQGGPAIADGTLFVGSLDHNLYAFDIQSGKTRWKMPAQDGINSSPTVAAGMVFVGSWDKQLYAFDAKSGHPLWTQPTGDFVNSSPAYASSTVYFGSKDAKLYAVRADTYDQVWTTPTQGEIASSPIVTNGIVFVGSWDHNLYAFDQKTGARLWNFTTENGIESSPTIAKGVVYIGSRDGKLYAFSLP